MPPKKKGHPRESGTAVPLDNNKAGTSRAVANNAMISGVANKAKAQRAAAKITNKNAIAKKGSTSNESARKITDQKDVAKKAIAKKKVANRKEAQQDTTKKGSSQRVVAKTSAAKRLTSEKETAKRETRQKVVANKAIAKKEVTKKEAEPNATTKKAITKERVTKKTIKKKKVNVRNEPIVEPKKPIATKEQQQQLKNLLIDLNMNALYKTKRKRPATWMYKEAKRFNANGRTANAITDIDELIQYGRGLLATTAVHPIQTMPISLCKCCNGVDVHAKPPKEFAHFFCESVNEVRVDCPICLERCRLPMVTECGHVFCTDCLRLMFGSHFKCPICQRMICPSECCMLK